MKVTAQYIGSDPELDQKLVLAAAIALQQIALRPSKVGDHIIENPDAQDRDKVLKANHLIPAHLNRHFVEFECETFDQAEDLIAALEGAPGVTVICNEKRPPSPASAALDPDGDQDLSAVEDFQKFHPAEPPKPFLVPPAPPAAHEQRFMKVYPCGCKAGPGPADMPDYCPEHGKADDVSGVVTYPFDEAQNTQGPPPVPPAGA